MVCSRLTAKNSMKRIAAHEVKDLMTKPAVYAYEDTSIGELATLIVEKKVNRIPIVNEVMEVVGLVSRHDLVRSMLTTEPAE